MQTIRGQFLPGFLTVCAYLGKVQKRAKIGVGMRKSIICYIKRIYMRVKKLNVQNLHPVWRKMREVCANTPLKPLVMRAKMG